MLGKNLGSGDSFVISYQNGEPSRIFRKHGNGSFSIAVRNSCGSSIEFQSVDAWPGIREKLKNLDDEIVVRIGTSPNGKPYFL